MNSDTRELGERIKARRKALGLTQTEVGRRMGINWQTYGDIELHTRDIRFSTLVPLCEALECAPNDLLGWRKE